jgi:uncharacterized protein (TIGR02099 family)
LRWVWRLAFGALFAAWSLLLLAWLVLHWGLLPRLGQWKPDIEARASQAIGAPVRIGALQVRSGGWMPAVQAQDVVLYDAAQREALRLPKVDVALSVRSLLALAAGQVRLEQLHIDGPDLEVRRSTAGQWFVAGVALGQAPGSAEGGNNELADWLFSQQEIAVRHGRVRWVDERRGSEPLVLTEVDLVLRNGLRGHALRLDATPPADTGERFTVQGDFEQPLWAAAGDWQRWRGTLHLNLPRATLTPTQAALPASPASTLGLYRVLPWQGASVLEGQAAMRAWVEVAEGRVLSATTDVAVRQLTVQFPGTVAPLAVQGLRGRLIAERQGGDNSPRWRLAAQQLGFGTADGVAWPASDWSLELQPAADGPSGFAGGALDAQRIDLAVLAQLAARLPLGEAVRKQLAQAAPTGVLSDFKLSWQGPVDAPTRYSAKGRAERLSLAAAEAASAPPGQHYLGRPGFRNAGASFDANESGGKATFAIAQGSLTLPGVFEQAEVALDKLSTQVQWKITPAAANKTLAPPNVSVTLSNTQFANADTEGVLKVAEWKTGAGPAGARGGRGAYLPGLLALEGQLTRGRAVAVARYLPLGLPESVRSYVQRAVLDGRVKETRFKVRGDLWDFPFSPSASAAQAPAGEFLLSAQVEDVSLAYVPAAAGQAEPPWPALSKVAGELVFDRNSMAIRNAQGRMWGVALSNVQGRIAELAQPVLRIDGQAQGPLADLLRYVNATPVGEWIGDGLREARGGGNADLKLAIELPMANLERTKVQGSLALGGNDLRITPSTPQLVQAKGKVNFTEQGFTVREGSARILGGEAKFEGASVPGAAEGDVKMRFAGEGTVTAEGLRQARELGQATRWATALSGQASYKLRLGFGGGHSEMALNTSLVGMGINLPAPFKKSPEAALPLKVSTELQAGATRDVLDVELGNWVQARYQRDLSGAQPRVLRGTLGVMSPMPPMPGPSERDVHAVLSLGSVKAEDWDAFMAPVAGNDATPAITGAGAGASVAEDYLPHTVAVRAQSLSTGGRTLTDVVLGVSQDEADGSWRGNINADQLGGYVEYRAARSATQPGRIHARLTRLALPPADVSSVENLFAESPANAPALDITIDNFELRGKKLGRVEIEANNRNREWRLSRFALITPEAQLVGTGQWQPRQRMVMDFKLDLQDSGAFLDRMGFAGTLRGGKGKLAGQLSWAGSPLAFHVPSLDGKINIALDAGQFLKAGPGAARLFSVLSLQALPRRLFLDFRDVFQEGFAFDNVVGDVTITDGVAATNNLRLRGVQAAVLMEGRADLQRETQDLRVVVVPDINAGTASLAYAVINPAVGLGTFFAQLLLRRPLMAANTREFSVQGSWAEPKVERVERKPGDPVPDIDAPRTPSPTPTPTPTTPAS